MANVHPVQTSGISDAEWQVRCDLAACYRAFVHYGWTDLLYTHISARHPEAPGQYLINPFGLMFEEITASNLIVVDFEGNVVRGDYPYNSAGHAIHSAVLLARDDVNWVLHTHTRAGMTVSCMACGLLPLTQQAMLLQGHVSYHPFHLQTSGPEECARLAADLGATNHAMILYNHGLLTCAPTVDEAFATLYNLEAACKVQVDAVQSGTALVEPDAEAVASMAEMGAPGRFPCAGVWPAVLRMVERSDPDHRD